MMNEQEQRVQKGIAWLDENHPGWTTKVEVERIDDRFYGQTVLGQVVGPDGFLAYIAEFKREDDSRGEGHVLYDLGFTDVVHPREIKAAWQTAVRERQQK